MHTEIFWQIALSLVPRIGPVHAKLLVEHFGSAEAIFKASRKLLSTLDGIGETRARNIKEFDQYKQVETEIRFIEQHSINTYFLSDKHYPQRLLHCYDPPCLLYGKGNMNLNHQKIVAVVGTRNHSAYGKQQTEQLVEGLKEYDVLVISGLALGIDAIAHRTAVKKGMVTVGVMANGIDRVYPPNHSSLVHDMLNTGGGVLTELTGGTQADKHFFPGTEPYCCGHGRCGGGGGNRQERGQYDHRRTGQQLP